MKHLPGLLFPFFLLLNILPATAQVTDENLVQFSGVTITADSLNPVPYAHILVKNNNRGAITDNYGYFSFVAHKRDTVLFNALGYKTAVFIIPDTITKQRYSLIQLMTADTLTLPAAYIFPWPTYEEFKQAFINLNIPDDDLEIRRHDAERWCDELQLPHAEPGKQTILLRTTATDHDLRSLRLGPVHQGLEGGEVQKEGV
jgi:hypothetical protein